MVAYGRPVPSSRTRIKCRWPPSEVGMISGSMPRSFNSAATAGSAATGSVSTSSSFLACDRMATVSRAVVPK